MKPGKYRLKQWNEFAYIEIAEGSDLVMLYDVGYGIGEGQPLVIPMWAVTHTNEEWLPL